ncbi:MAG TPA: hypothetical protein VFF74_10565 [Methylophilaceae bacterium]|nr:hypothetical protein [Methylophilaceae bacterium]
MKVITAKAIAAGRQLDVAIELLLSDREPLAVRTLAAAAHTIFADLVEKERPGESWRNHLIQDSGLTRDEAINVLNRASNFLKHADRDPEAELSFEEEENDYLIFFATLECGELGHPLSLTMQVFQVWYLACHPEYLGENRELVLKAKTAFPELSKLDRQAQLKKGLQFLPEVFAKYGNVGLTHPLNGAR